MTLGASFDSFPRNLALVVVLNTVLAFGLTAANPTDVFENFRPLSVHRAVRTAPDRPAHSPDLAGGG